MNLHLTWLTETSFNWEPAHPHLEVDFSHGVRLLQALQVEVKTE